MIDLNLAREWLEAEKGRVNPENFSVRVTLNPEWPKPSIVVIAEGKSVVGQFAVWATGEADYDIAKGATVIDHDWGMVVDNDTMRDAFFRFMKVLSSHEV